MNSQIQRKIGVLLSYFSILINLLVGALYTPFALQKMGQSGYGNYYYVSSIVSYLSLLTCGFGSAYLRFASPYRYKKDEYGERKVNGLFLMLFILMASIALIIGSIMVWKSDFILGGKLTQDELRTGKILMGIMVANIFASFPVSVFNSYIIANEQFVFQKSMAMISAIITPLSSVVVLTCGFGSIGVAAVTFCVTLAVNSTSVLYCIIKLKMRFIFDIRDIWLVKEVFVFSSFILLSMIVDQINWSVDKYLLGKICGTMAVAVYNLAATINTYYKTMGEAISNVFVPKVYSIINGENGDWEATKLMTRLGRIQSIVLCLIVSGFILFGKKFILLWVGADYNASYYVVLLLLIPVTIPEIQKIGLEIQRAKNLHKFRSVVYAIIAIINVCISIPLCKQFGPIGAALGTAITVTFGNGLVMNVYYHKRVGVNILYFWKNVLSLLPYILFAGGFGVILKSVFKQNTWIALGISIILYTGFYLGCIYRGLKEDEKKTIWGIIRR